MDSTTIIRWSESYIIHSRAANAMALCDIPVSAWSIVTGREVLFNLDKGIARQERAIVDFSSTAHFRSGGARVAICRLAQPCS